MELLKTSTGKNMEDLCILLVKTYNTNVLDQAEDDMLNIAFRKKAEIKCIGERKVLKSLILNHFDTKIKKPSPSFIGGPKTLTMHWSEKYQKIIYIFGEWHLDEIDCSKYGKKVNMMNIENFLTEFLRTTDVFADIYFEVPSYRKEIGKYDDKFKSTTDTKRLNILFHRFKKCIQYATRSAEECKMSRIHYFDVRKQDIEGKLSSSNYIGWFGQNIHYITNKYDRSEWAGKFKQLVDSNQSFRVILKGLAESNDIKFINFWINQFEDNDYIKKSLVTLEKDQYIKSRILKFIKKEFIKQTIKYRQTWKDKVSIILNHTFYTENIFLSAIDIIDKTTIGLNALLADTYLLSRVFKQFNMDEMKEKAYEGVTDQPDKAYNIIIYAGDDHSKRCRKFLDKLGFKQIAKTGITDNKPVTCLDMRSFPMPFFSGWPPKNELI